MISPESFKVWVDLVTPAGLLVVACFAFWKICSWLGPKIEHFLVTTQEAIREMPIVVGSLHTTNEEQTRYLEQLADLHSDPEATFSTVKTNERLDDLIKAHQLTGLAIRKLAKHNDVDVDTEITQANTILNKWNGH